MLDGFRLLPGYLSPDDQAALAEALRAVVRAAPLYTPTMPRSGKPLSVRMTNCGELGWVSDRGGYRYQAMHPETDRPWPAMPEMLLGFWADLAGYPHPPQACLVNFYGEGAKLGLHRDEDEEDFDAPVVSLSLGDTARFRLGGLQRKDKTHSFPISSGDAMVLGGKARLAFHGVDKVLTGTSKLLKSGGRVNLTLRRVAALG